MSDVIQDLVERVQRLEDLEAIQSAWRDYLFALDSADYEALADVFTEDGVVEMVGLDSYQPGQDRSYHGREEIINDFYVPVIDVVARLDLGQYYTGHHGTNMEIDLQGDEATTLAYFFEILGNTQMLIGTYQHRFRREADRWRIAYLRIAIRYRAVIQASDFGGLSLADVRAMAQV
jgi:ketosteroid isomerase-like protein